METAEWVAGLIFVIAIFNYPFTTKETVCYYETFQEQEDVSSDILGYEEKIQVTLPPKKIVTFKVINRDVDTGGKFTVATVFEPIGDIKIQPIPIPGLLKFGLKPNEYLRTGSAEISANSEGIVTVDFSSTLEQPLTLIDVPTYKVTKYELIRPRKIATKLNRSTRLEEVTFSIFQRLELFIKNRSVNC